MNIGIGHDFAVSGELFAINYARRALKRADPLTVFDVGANVGGYANAVIRQLGGQLSLYCFEPSKATFQRLSEALSGAGNVRLLNIGLSDVNGSLVLYTDTPCSGLASFYHRRLDHFGNSMPISEDVTTRTLDSFCGEHGINHINFLKLDVEGHELRVLEGARELIANSWIDFIQFEFGGCNIDSRTFFQDFYYLLNPKFRIYRILRNGLASIDHYRETLEQFVTTNFLAVGRRVAPS
jgi:FkbM family methyltransferase